MKSPLSRNNFQAAFSLFEVLLAIGVFSLAAMGLAGALNSIGAASVEINDEASIREQLRSLLLEKARAPNLYAIEEQSNPDANGIIYFTRVVRLEGLENREGLALQGLFEITVTAIQQIPGREDREVDSASTYSFPGLF